MGNYTDSIHGGQPGTPPKEALLERALCAAVARLANDADGLTFLRWLLTRQCGLLYAGYPPDHPAAAWEAGKRAVGVEVLARARAAGVLGTIFNDMKGDS